MMVDELQFVEYTGTKDEWVKRLNEECAEGWRPVWSMMIEEPKNGSVTVLINTITSNFSVWMYRKYSTKHRLNLSSDTYVSE